jgi:chaperonin cofactor prefoldin
MNKQAELQDEIARTEKRIGELQSETDLAKTSLSALQSELRSLAARELPSSLSGW